MTSTSTATWGIGGAVFLYIYCALCAAAAIAIWWRWSRAGVAQRDGDIDMFALYELAMLSGGPQRAITSATVQLHREVPEGRFGRRHAQGHLRVGGAPGRDRAGGARHRQAPAADRGRRAARRQRPADRARRAHGAAAAAVALRRHAGRLGMLRIGAGAPSGRALGLLAILILVVFTATLAASLHAPRIAGRGRAVLARWRHSHSKLRRQQASGQGGLSVALFGAGALWLAAPEIASALSIEREAARGSGGDGGGGWSDGGGGCGGCGGLWRLTPPLRSPFLQPEVLR